MTDLIVPPALSEGDLMTAEFKFLLTDHQSFLSFSR
jgi:hypothetical protein